MVSDQANTRNPIFMLIFALIVLVITISIVMLYLAARQNALAKMQPYVVEFQYSANVVGNLGAPEQLIAQYDYGYGFNRGHAQSNDVVPSRSPQTFSFTVSSWKPLHSLKLTSNAQTPIQIEGISISKHSAQYQVAQTGLIGVNRELVIDNVPTDLFEAN